MGEMMLRGWLYFPSHVYSGSLYSEQVGLPARSDVTDREDTPTKALAELGARQSKLASLRDRGFTAAVGESLGLGFGLAVPILALLGDTNPGVVALKFLAIGGTIAVVIFLEKRRAIVSNERNQLKLEEAIRAGEASAQRNQDLLMRLLRSLEQGPSAESDKEEIAEMIDDLASGISGARASQSLARLQVVGDRGNAAIGEDIVNDD